MPTAAQRVKPATRRVAMAVVIMMLAAVVGTRAMACRREPCRGDVTPPIIRIAAPVDGAVVSGRTVVTGTATDDKRVVEVGVRIDASEFSVASGTGTWTYTIETGALEDGPHRIAARAFDRAGNLSATSLWVNVDNEGPTTADVTPPTATITVPGEGALLSGSLMVLGTATDDTSVAVVELRVDDDPFTAATGTDAWTTTLDTAAYADGSHEISVRAIDEAGNVGTGSQHVTFDNVEAPPPSPAPEPSPSPSPELEPAPLDDRHIVTPEGATIDIAPDVTGWTARQVYDLLKPNAFQLDRIGPTLTVKVQTTYASQTSTSAGTSGGQYATFRSTIYLHASKGSFPKVPEMTIAHEYGHAWTMYHLYLTQQKDWSSWLAKRGLTDESRLETSYVWTKAEILAEDYRFLFGTDAAISGATVLNPYIADARAVPGYRDWFVTAWAGG